AGHPAPARPQTRPALPDPATTTPGPGDAVRAGLDPAGGRPGPRRPARRTHPGVDGRARAALPLPPRPRPTRRPPPAARRPDPMRVLRRPGTTAPGPHPRRPP